MDDFNKRDEIVADFNSKSLDWKIGTEGYQSGHGYPIYHNGKLYYTLPEKLIDPN